MKRMTTLMGIIMLVLIAGVSAKLELDSINFDPAIIAAGDEVDVVIQFHAQATSQDEMRINNPQYKFKITLQPDDTLTEKYVLITDAMGDTLHGSLFAGDYYNKKYRVKVLNNAPAGNYEFKLEGVWYKEGVPESGSQFVRFTMPVKKEGIILDITTIETVPAEVRPGDNFVKIVGRVENVGEKDAKSVEVNLALPEGISASYTNNNRLWVGSVGAGESKEVTFFADVDETIDSGVYELQYTLDYMDLDNNGYEKVRTIPFLVKPRPYLEVVGVSGTGLAGDEAQMHVTVKNTGSESAEAVDVRIIKQNSQPFTIDVRSDYIGELEPGEEGVAIFDIKVNRDAQVKEHDFKLLIRSKGDSDEGDDNIYTYNRRAQFEVTGHAENKLLWAGLLAFGLVLILLIFGKINKQRKLK